MPGEDRHPTHRASSLFGRTHPAGADAGGASVRCIRPGASPPRREGATIGKGSANATVAGAGSLGRDGRRSIRRRGFNLNFRGSKCWNQKMDSRPRSGSRASFGRDEGYFGAGGCRGSDGYGEVGGYRGGDGCGEVGGYRGSDGSCADGVIPALPPSFPRKRESIAVNESRNSGAEAVTPTVEEPCASSVVDSELRSVGSIPG